MLELANADNWRERSPGGGACKLGQTRDGTPTCREGPAAAVRAVPAALGATAKGLRRGKAAQLLPRGCLRCAL